MTERGRASGAYRAWRRAAGVSGFAAGAMLHNFALTTASAQDVFSPPDEPARYMAVPARESMIIDGRLDEAVWQRAEQITEFVQKDPEQGQPISYPTVVRVAYDETALYIAAICYQPRDAARVQNLKRDFSYDENDLFGIAIDGFMDKRNAVVFQTTPYGSQRDMEVIDGSEVNDDWDARWSVRTRIEDDRWVAEMAIPWRNLRYPSGADRFGVIFARNIRSRNENTSAPAVPRAFTIYRMAYGGVLEGVRTPPPSTNLQFNPYSLVQQLDESGAGATTEYDVGGEVKWAISQSTVLDLTVNTDFAQADVDRQVVNLDRFSVFFPERRQFFLENANVFNASVTNWIRPFFSRRIGLDGAGNPLPLDGGLRLTSRSSRQELGLLAMHQPSRGNNPDSTFGVARYSRNVAGQSRLGGMLTWRRDGGLRAGDMTIEPNRNVTVTVDGLWRPRQSYGVQAMVSMSQDDLSGDGVGSQFWAFYENNFVYLGLLEYFNKDYNPGIGLEILDTNYVMHSPAVYFDIRSERLPAAVRSFNPGAVAYIFQDSEDGDLLFGYAPLRPLRVNFQNGARISAFVEPNWQRLEEPFFPVGIEIAPGDYDYTRYRLDVESDQSAKLAGEVEIETGDYFDGELTTYTLSGRYAPSPRIEVSADVELNRIRGLGIARRDENTRLYGLNLRMALNPRLQFNAFFQHNSANETSNWNVRLAWEYRPLSYLYVVYNRNDIERIDRAFRETGEQLIAKFTYLFEV
ncbi:MAG: DUF5916 domain-containing protein [Pseudomonadota bacterium]